MKRSPLAPSKKPMKRSAFKLADKPTAMRRSSIRARARKPKPGDDKTLRDACRNEPCYLQFPALGQGPLRDFG